MGETDDEALAIARRAYPLWHKHFHHLFQLHGTSPAGGDRPPQFDQIKDGGRGIAGSPATVTRMIRSQMEEAGTNYFVGQFAFGDLTSTEVLRTIDLFAREVMPALGNGDRMMKELRASIRRGAAPFVRAAAIAASRTIPLGQESCIATKGAMLRCARFAHWFHRRRRPILHRTIGSGQRIQVFQLVTSATNARYDIFTTLPATLPPRCSAASGCRL